MTSTGRVGLFHGTSSRFLRQIKADGLLPRSRTGRSVYQGELASAGDSVYLSDTYAVEFARPAVQAFGGRMMIALAFVEPERLLPDSDFQDGGLHHFRAADWKHCLKMTGCVRVAGPVIPGRLYVIPKALERGLQETEAIYTGLMHLGIGRYRRDRLDWLLKQCPRWVADEGGWWYEG